MKNLYFVIIFLFLSACQTNSKNIAFDADYAKTSTPNSIIVPSTTIAIPTTQDQTTQVPDFDFKSGQTNLPEDIIQQLGGTGGAGGGPGCYENKEIPYIVPPEYENVAVMDTALFILCNMKPKEKIFIKIISQGEFSVESEKEVDKNGELFYRFIPEIDDPLGKYYYSLSGESQKFSGEFLVTQPETPMLYIVQTSEDDWYKQKFILYNFQSKEKVRLFAYAEGKLINWQEYITDIDGSLSINFEHPDEYMSFIAVGERSGQADTQPKGGGNIMTQDIYCPGALPPNPGIKPGSQAIVVSENAQVEYGVYNQSTNKITHKFLSLPRGTRLKIGGQDSPSCSNNSFMWVVNCDSIGDGSFCSNEFTGGFISESKGTEYIIKPIE